MYTGPNNQENLLLLLLLLTLLLLSLNYFMRVVQKFKQKYWLKERERHTHTQRLKIYLNAYLRL